MQSKVTKLASRKTKRTAALDSRKKRAADARATVVDACDRLKKVSPHLDYLVLFRNQWHAGRNLRSQFWMSNSIKTTHNQWPLPLKTFVSLYSPETLKLH
jgi:hypothetical protein